MKEDIIKKFRERFGRFYCDKVKQEIDMRGTLQVASDDIEEWWLSKLASQKQEIIEMIEKEDNKYVNGKDAGTEYGEGYSNGWHAFANKIKLSLTN